MTQSPDHPELLYVEALKTDGKPMYTIGRPDGKPLWVVIHDMEKTESSGCAEWTANYFHTGAGGRSVSSHYTADNDSIVQCVLLRHSAWTVGNRPGNNRGINWELCGYAAQTRTQWLDAFGLAMFSRMVPIIRSDAAKYGIPLVKRTIAELRAWTPGVTSHNDLGLAFGGTDHTDPGSNFPWDVFMQMLTGGTAPPPSGGDDDMLCQQGETGPKVQALQFVLIECGADLGPAGADAKYGQATANALGAIVGDSGQFYGPWQWAKLFAKLAQVKGGAGVPGPAGPAGPQGPPGKDGLGVGDPVTVTGTITAS